MPPRVIRIGVGVGIGVAVGVAVGSSGAAVAVGVGVPGVKVGVEVAAGVVAVAVASGPRVAVGSSSEHAANAITEVSARIANSIGRIRIIRIAIPHLRPDRFEASVATYSRRTEIWCVSTRWHTSLRFSSPCALNITALHGCQRFVGVIGTRVERSWRVVINQQADRGAAALATILAVLSRRLRKHAKPLL